MSSTLAKAEVALERAYPDYRKLVKALMVGVLATLVDTAFLFIFKGSLGVSPVIAKAMSFLIGMCVSFYFNKTFTFRNTYDKPHYQFVSFVIIGFTQYLLTLGVFYFFVHVIFPDQGDIYILISNILVAFIGFFYAFTLNKSLTFKLFK